MSAKRCNLSWQTQWCWNDRNCCSHLKCFKMLWNALSRQSGVASSPRFLWIKNVFEQRNWRTLRKTFVFVISCLIPKKSLNFMPTICRQNKKSAKAHVWGTFYPHEGQCAPKCPPMAIYQERGRKKRMRKDGFWPWVGNGRLRGAGLAWIAAIWQLRPAQRYWLSVCTEGGILPNSFRFVFDPYILKF